MVFEIKDIDSFLLSLKNNNLSDNAYLSYEYFSVLCRYHKPASNEFICFVVKNENDQIVGYLPLVKRHLDFVILGYRYSNYLGYICKEGDVKYVDDEIKKYIKINHRSFVVTYYDINDRYALFKILKDDKKAQCSFLYNCPFCETTDTFENVFSRQIAKAKKRTELRKFRNKLDLVGKIEFLDIDNKDSWEKGKKYFNQIFKIHKERFSGVYIPKDLSLNCNTEYYAELFENLVTEGKAYLSLLLLDEHVISFVYSVVSDRIIMDWMPAFDPAFTKYNLGTVHLMHILNYACANEYRVFDFSKGDGTYKDRWANGSTKSYMFVRRFSSSLLAIIKMSIVYSLFSFKGYLREKGVLRKVKKILGRNTEIIQPIDNVDAYPFISSAENDSCCDMIEFSYPLVMNETVEIRKNALDRIYNGEKLYVRNATRT